MLMTEYLSPLKLCVEALTPLVAELEDEAIGKSLGLDEVTGRVAMKGLTLIKRVTPELAVSAP